MVPGVIMADEMRDDGTELATKSDLRDLARGLATKVELQSVRNELSARLDDHDRRFDGIDGNLRNSRRFSSARPATLKAP
jgi:hypothetical protein